VSKRDASSQVFDVNIAGVPLRLKSSHDEKSVQELVRIVDEKIQNALTQLKSGSIQNAAILACLNLAEEYVQLKQQTKAELSELELRAEKVLSDLGNSRITQ